MVVSIMQQHRNWLCLLLLVSVAAQSFVFAEQNPLPPTPAAPTPVPSSIDPCLMYSGCSNCVQDSRCLWCLSATTHPCRSKSFCPLTGYSDCCVLLKTCTTCKSHASCGFCSDTNLCIPGNATAPRGTTCSSWHFNSCPNPNKNSNLSILLAVMLTIGSGVVILSVVLLVLFIRRIMRQNRARRDMNEYYQQTRTVCDFCQDVLATVICKECKLNLCEYCVLSEDLHPRGTNHTFEAIEYNVQDEGQLGPSQPLRKEEAYTSFAGMISKNSSGRSYTSYGSHG